MAAAVLGESARGEEAARLLAGRWELIAPAHWKAEFCNVLWKAVRMGRVAAEEIDAIMNHVSALAIESVEVAELWRGAVARAVAADHRAYDTLFIELAVRSRTRMASYDEQLQRKFPTVVRSPRALLAS